MLRRLKALEGYSLQAVDGTVGRVAAFYFNEDSWIIRYLGVDAGEWLPGKNLFFTTQSIGDVDHEAQVFRLKMRRGEIPISPPLVDEHHGPLGVGDLTAIPLIELADDIAETRAGEVPEPGHLLNSEEMRGYTLQARDGDIGSVDDLVFDDEGWDEGWKILYLIVDMGGLLSSKQVVVSPTWISRIDRENSRVEIDLKRETIEHSPVLETDTPIDREFETRLYDHFGKNKYWQED